MFEHHCALALTDWLGSCEDFYHFVLHNPGACAAISKASRRALYGKKGLLGGLMIGHSRFVKIGPDFPASLSRHLIQILSDMGFKGLAITDALRMMDIIARFGQKLGIGYAVGNAAEIRI